MPSSKLGFKKNKKSMNHKINNRLLRFLEMYMCTKELNIMSLWYCKYAFFSVYFFCSVCHWDNRRAFCTSAEGELTWITLWCHHDHVKTYKVQSCAGVPLTGCKEPHHPCKTIRHGGAVPEIAPLSWIHSSAISSLQLQWRLTKANTFKEAK